MPSNPTLVQTAALAPGVCFLSGDNHGPFLDTGTSVPGRGRIYLSIKALGPFLRECDWVPLAEVEEELAQVHDFETQLDAHQAGSDAYDAIVEAITPLLPAPPVQRTEVAVFMDDSVRADNARLEDEVSSLRIELHGSKRALESAQDAAVPAPTSEGSAPVEQGTAAPSTEVDVAGQTVDLELLPEENVDVVLDVVDGWDDEALAAVVALEATGKARKTILALAP